MEKYCFPNEKAPCRGFLTLAHAGDPTPVIWIAAIIAYRSRYVKRGFDYSRNPLKIPN
jgi:hypothetical protein